MRGNFSRNLWTPLPASDVGKLVYLLCTESSVLPIRDVLNDQGQGLKLEPNYETGTYNFCRFCNHRSVVAAIRHGYRYLLFFTRYWGLDHRFRGQYYVVGYYDLESWMELGTRKAVKAKRLKFVRIEDAFHVTPEICRKWGTTYGNLRWLTQVLRGENLEEVLGHLQRAPDATSEYITEVKKLSHKLLKNFQVPMGRIFIVNVGVNVSDYPLQSPIFADGSFEFIPIREYRPFEGPYILTYRDLRSYYWGERDLLRYIPERFHNTQVHDDPEFDTPSYGDSMSPRAANLRQVKAEDFLFFLARLVRYRSDRFSGQAGFYFVGFIEAEEVLTNVSRRPAPEVIEAWRRNAHIRRGLANPSGYDGFYAFRGTERSTRFWRAVRLDRNLAEKCLRSAAGQPWRWDPSKSDLQVIGSYTRAARCHMNPAEPSGFERASDFWQAIIQVNPDVATRFQTATKEHVLTCR